MYTTQINYDLTDDLSDDLENDYFHYDGINESETTESHTISPIIISSDDESISADDSDCFPNENANDEHAPNGMFTEHVIIYNNNKTFGKNGSGKIKYKVEEKIPILPNEDVEIYQNEETSNIYCYEIEMIEYILSSDKRMKLMMEYEVKYMIECILIHHLNINLVLYILH